MATLIYDVDDLQDMNLDLDGDYELANNIDASATSGWNSGAGFEPIGTFVNPFTGTFDGKGYTISNLYINRSATNYVGLFGSVEGSVIRNVTLSGGSITSTYDRGYTGALIGELDSRLLPPEYTEYAECSVENCHSDLPVNGKGDVGGLIGQITTQGDALVYQCSCTGNVTSTCTSNADSAGGLIGNSFAAGTETVIRQCLATGNVTQSQNVGDTGGLIGNAGNVNVEDCYATGNIDGGDSSVDNSGGLIGMIYGNPLQRCYSIGTVDGYYTGGLCEGFEPDIDIDNFWDMETSGELTSAAGIGKTTAQMKIMATFSGWNIALYDTLYNSGYPFLGWEVSDTEHIWLIYGTLSPREEVEVEDQITLEAIRNIEIMARGQFYVDENGNAIYKSRFVRG